MKTVQTLAELRAILDERRPYAEAIAEAMRNNDLKAAEAAQKAMRTISDI